MQQTSLWAYDEVKRTGKEKSQMNRVYAIIASAKKGFGRTDKEIEHITGIMRTSVIPRRRRLMKEHFVVCIGNRPCEITGRYVRAYQAR